ncbi:unnamed protein product [Lymnaea stagnalis]|uniref:RCC1-like domain-containing protein n=1 Tax=Lymnaea stagnalis TaxID=6523 RepID=A0AAV2I1H2_LYMST
MAVYTWGFGKNGQLGLGNKETVHTPQPANKTSAGQNLKSVVQVCCGGLFTAIVTRDGCLYTAGCGKFGRLGLGDSEDDVPLFSLVNSFGGVQQVSCGSWHAAAVTVEGQVYIWGHKKACGNSITSSSEGSAAMGIPSHVSYFTEVKVSGVACGHNYTYVWTSEGRVYSWGRGQHGVLGHGSDRDILSPTKLEQLSEFIVVAVDAGYSHCGTVTQCGLLFVSGKGSDGALGQGQSQLTDVYNPTKCDTAGCHISSVSCSKGEHHGHTLALTKQGEMLVWGDGYKGKLGLGDQKSRYTPTPVPKEYFNNEAVVSISAGGIHSSAATSSGSVYTWGCGSDGRLGHRDGQGHRYLFRSDVPRKVEELPQNELNTASVSASYYHTAALFS